MKEIKYIIFSYQKLSGSICILLGLLFCSVILLPSKDSIFVKLPFFGFGVFFIWVGTKQITEKRVTEINYEEDYVEQRWGVFKQDKVFRINLSCFTEVFVKLDHVDRSSYLRPQTYGVCLVGRHMVYEGKTVKKYLLYITPHLKFRKARDLALEISEYTKLPFDPEKKPDYSIGNFERVTNLKYNEWF
jgi:hypothetical protein